MAFGTIFFYSLYSSKLDKYAGRSIAGIDVI